jgi:hypothetical protein
MVPARSRTVEASTALPASTLADAQDALAREACRQDPEACDVLLMNAIGTLWRDGTLRMMHDYLASAVVRTFL